MNSATPRHVLHFVTRRLGLRRYLQNPGDGRPQPQIPAQALLWALLVGQILRQSSFHAVEALVRSSARRTLAIAAPFREIKAIHVRIEHIGHDGKNSLPPPRRIVREDGVTEIVHVAGGSS